MKKPAQIFLALLVLAVPTLASAQEATPGTEEKAAGKPFYGYAGWGILAFGALWGACKASRR
ncbi:MAG: hypothetical protein ACKO85_06545 [Isosphaeraceae bacterium]